MKYSEPSGTNLPDLTMIENGREIRFKDMHEFGDMIKNQLRDSNIVIDVIIGWPTVSMAMNISSYKEIEEKRKYVENFIRWILKENDISTWRIQIRIERVEVLAPGRAYV